MKKLLTMLVAIGATLITSAQLNHKYCGSAEYLQALEISNPGITQYVKDLASQPVSKTRNTVITIPVVVHIVYKNATENLADSYISAQIDLLNKSFLRQNADTTNLRSTFQSIVGPAKIQFMLVQTKRVSTTKSGFEMDYNGFTGYLYADDVKQTNFGGSDAVDPTRKLNIWVCDITEPSGLGEVLGYAYPPSGLSNWPGGSSASTTSLDGVVIDYVAFGGDSKKPLGLMAGLVGKTAVHEVGHYLGLRHIWGDDNGACSTNPIGEDGVADTPSAGDASNFDCDKVKNTCNSTQSGDKPDMVENYMDYSKESCQNSFTKGQVSLMEGVLANQRVLVRIPTSVNDVDYQNHISVYPNPAQHSVNVSLYNLDFETVTISLLDPLGKQIERKILQRSQNQSGGVEFNMSQLPKGIYFFKFTIDGKDAHNQKVMKL